MICDRIANAALYPAVNARFQAAFDYLTTFRSADFQAGKHVLDGERLFVIHSAYETRDEAEAFLEAHRRYADIMLMVRGAEQIAWKPTEQLACVTAEYDPQGDASLAKIDADASHLVLTEGCFVVFLPGDAHGPELHFGPKAPVQKLIMKVLLTD